jgi:hypothetical protein
MFSMLREAPGADGKPGPLSYRRCASAVLLLAALPAFFLGLKALPTLPAATPGWVVFIPGALCLGGAILMPILTTVSDIKTLVSSVTRTP